MNTMKSRKPSRPWTRQEDEILRAAVKSFGGAIDWHDAASRLPQRSNKDCRKRWVYSLQTSINKGPWSEDEDKRLLKGVEQHGFRWAHIGPTVVGTRQPDQCSRRWHEVLNPSISHEKWSDEEDEILEMAVGVHGRRWTEIVERFFPNRTPIAARTRFAQRFEKGEGANNLKAGPAHDSRASQQTASNSYRSDSYEPDDSRGDSSDDETSSITYSVTSGDVRGQSQLSTEAFNAGDMVSEETSQRMIPSSTFLPPSTYAYNSNLSFVPSSYGSSYGKVNLGQETSFDTISYHPGYRANVPTAQQPNFQTPPTGRTVNYAQEQNPSAAYFGLLDNEASGMLNYGQVGQMPSMFLNSHTTTSAEIDNFGYGQSQDSSVHSYVQTSDDVANFDPSMPLLDPRFARRPQSGYRG